MSLLFDIIYIVLLRLRNTHTGNVLSLVGLICLAARRRQVSRLRGSQATSLNL